MSDYRQEPLNLELVERVKYIELDAVTGKVLDVNVTGDTIQERFESFHELNPWVLTALEDLTRDYLDHQNRRIGIGMLTEVLRWQYGRRTQGDDFKLNNNFRSRYVRLMVDRHPEWAGAFETRELRAP